MKPIIATDLVDSFVIFSIAGSPIFFFFFFFYLIPSDPGERRTERWLVSWISCISLSFLRT